MFEQICPRCKSSRIQLGFNDAPIMLHLIGVRELLCNNCNLEFKRFVLGRPPRRTISDKTEVSCNKRRAQRFNINLPVQVAIVLTEDRGGSVQYSSPLQGYTRDVSKIGLAIVLPANRIEGQHPMPAFAGQNRMLWVQLGLSSGTVTMRATPIRCEALNQSAAGRLVGVHIKSVHQADQARFFNYLHLLESRTECPQTTVNPKQKLLLEI